MATAWQETNPVPHGNKDREQAQDSLQVPEAESLLDIQVAACPPDTPEAVHREILPVASAWRLAAGDIGAEACPVDTPCLVADTPEELLANYIPEEQTQGEQTQGVEGLGEGDTRPPAEADRGPWAGGASFADSSSDPSMDRDRP